MHDSRSPHSVRGSRVGWACVYGGAGVVGGSELWLAGFESWALGLMHRAGLTRGGPSWHWVDGGFSPLLCRLPFMAVARIRCFSCAGLCALHCPPRVWRLRAHWLCCSLGTVASARAPFPTSLGTLLSSRSQIWSRSSHIPLLINSAWCLIYDYPD